MSFFSEVLKTFKHPQSDTGVLNKLDRYLLSLDGKLMKDKEDEREQGVYHPSELSTNPCTRAITYRSINAPATNERVLQPRVKRVFDVGHHFGFILQQYFWDMGILEGEWRCVECKHEWYGISPKTCPSCKTKLFIWYNLRYKEVPIRNEKWNVAGHSDGIIHLNGQKTLIEIKSIKNRDSKTSEKAITFEDLNQAIPAHVQQANLYMDALDIDNGLIIYFAKNTQEIKEFQIKRMETMLRPSYEKIIEVEKAKKEKILPERAGRIKSDPICTYCPFKDLCWDNNYTFEEVANMGENKYG